MLKSLIKRLTIEKENVKAWEVECYIEVEDIDKVEGKIWTGIKSLYN